MNAIRRIMSMIVIAGCLLVLSTTLAQSGPVTIAMWHIATEGDPFRPVLLQAIDQFNATHFNIRFEAQAIDNEVFKSQLQDAIANNIAPDVFQTWGGGLLETYVERGVVREIPELNGEAGQRFNPQALAFSTFDGRRYAIPANMAGIFLWYNQDLFARHQVELPTTWDQLMNACRTFRQAGIVPIALGNRDRWPGAFWLIYLAMRIGGTETALASFDAPDSAIFDHPAFIEAGRRLQDAVRAGCFEENFSGQDFGAVQQLLGTGAAAMQLQGDWNLGGLRNMDATLTATHIRVLPFPQVEGGAGNPSDMVGGTGQAFAISANAPPEAAEALLQMLSSDAFGRAVAEAGFIPALAGYEQYVTDPLVREMASMVTNASSVQLYYDQVLPSSLAQVHLDTTQALFDLSLSPEEAVRRMVTAVQQGTAMSNLPLLPLRELADARGIGIGTAVSIQPLRNNPAYIEILRQEFNMLTPEMAMKMDALRPSRDAYHFDDADYIVEFAEASGMQVRGHPLVWYNQLPGWLQQGSFSRDELIQILRDHIMTVVARYRGRVIAWDVVNEAITEDGQLRDNIWLRGIGPEYIDYAFQWAREADPNALLFYNDFNGEGLNTKSDAIYQLVQGLVQRGVPIDGVGMQMHISIGDPPPMEDVAANMYRIAELGLQVQITEMDVKIQDGQGTEQERFMQQAQLYSEVTRVCLAVEACTALGLWGFTDEHTWIPEYTGHDDAPLVFDRSYQPKPAYHALQVALTA